MLQELSAAPDTMIIKGPKFAVGAFAAVVKKFETRYRLKTSRNEVQLKWTEVLAQYKEVRELDGMQPFEFDNRSMIVKPVKSFDMASPWIKLTQISSSLIPYELHSLRRVLSMDTDILQATDPMTKSLASWQHRPIEDWTIMKGIMTKFENWIPPARPVKKEEFANAYEEDEEEVPRQQKRTRKERPKRNVARDNDDDELAMQLGREVEAISKSSATKNCRPSDFAS